jgi:hypothetical protein
MKSIWNKKLMVGTMTAALTLGGLTACGDGADQDNGISDGEQKDQLDTDNPANDNMNETEQEMEQQMEEAEQEMEQGANELEKEMEESGIGDGIDQDNGISDGEKKDELDNKNPETN